MSKYKVGDLVLIKKWDDMVDEFGINDGYYIKTDLAFTYNMKQFCNNIYEIISKDDGKYKLKGTDGYSFIDDMIERKVNDNMTKSDLRSGMIVKTREGERYITIVKEDGEIHFINLDGTTCLGSCDLLDDMTDNIDSDYDIIKIYKMDTTLRNCKTTKDLIWERQEQKEMTIAEIEKELGYSIKIIKED